MPVGTVQDRIVCLYKNLRIKGREVVDDLLEDRVRGIALVVDTEAYRDFVYGIVLTERGGYAVV